MLVLSSWEDPRTAGGSGRSAAPQALKAVCLALDGAVLGQKAQAEDGREDGRRRWEDKSLWLETRTSSSSPSHPSPERWGMACIRRKDS